MGANRMRLRRGWVGRHFFKLSAVAFFGYFSVSYYLFAIWRYQPACERYHSVIVEGILTEHYRNFVLKLLAKEGFHFLYVPGDLARGKYTFDYPTGAIYTINSPFLPSAFLFTHDDLFLNYEWRYISNILYDYRESGERPALAQRIIAALDGELEKHISSDQDDFMAVEADGKQYPHALLRSCSVVRAALIVPGTGLQDSPNGFTDTGRGRWSLW